MSFSIRYFKSILHILCVITASLVLLPTVKAEASTLYAVEAYDGLLHQVNLADGSVISTTNVTIGGTTEIDGFTGLAAHPLTGQLFALAITNGDFGAPRSLVTIHPTSGIATVVGNPGVRLNSLAFDESGTLYTVGGTNTANAGRLLTISTIDGSVVDFAAVSGEVDGGHNIAINSDDGLLYHIYDFNPFRMETVSLSDGMLSSIGLSGDDFQLILGLTYDSEDATLVAAAGYDWFHISTAGFSAEVGADTSSPYNFRGLALVPIIPEPNTLILASFLALCHYRKSA